MVTFKEVFFHCSILTFMCLGVWDVLFNYEENGCEMTYMFEYPKYLKVYSAKVPSNEYSLYLYGEGQYFNNIQNLKLQGIPVLFIPGHAGSYQQARSLGSVLLRKAIDKRRTNHFNVFTIDFQEEFVALYGGTLTSQTQFVHDSMKYILSLYEFAQFKPTSVILVGHSIGGILARGVFTLDNFNPNIASTIITLGTPNLAPVLNIDFLMANFYAEVNDYWNTNAESLSHVTVISIAGDDRDFQVSSSLTRLPSTEGNNTNYLSTVTTAIPDVRVSVDHRCLAWCKQLYLVTTRFLFDAIDPEKKQVTENTKKRNQLMKYYFGERNEHLKNVELFDKPKAVKISKSYNWENVSSFLWSFSSTGAYSDTYFIISLKELTDVNAPNFISRTDLARKRWILGCRSYDAGRCTKAFDISYLAVRTLKYQVVHLDLNHMMSENYTHILLPYTEVKGIQVLDVNIFSDLELSVEFTAPHVFSNLWSMNKGHSQVLNKDLHIKMNKRFYYKVMMNGFSSIYQTFKLTLQGSEGDLRVEVPWDWTRSVFGTNSVKLKMQKVPLEEDNNAVVHVYTQSPGDSPVVLSARVEFAQVLGQIIRFLGNGIPVYVIANILLIYHYQLKQLSARQPCHTLNDAHFVSGKPYKIQPFISLINLLYGFPWGYRAWEISGLPTPDVQILAKEHRVWFSFAPFLLFIFAYAVFSVMLVSQKCIIYLITKASNLSPAFISLSYFESKIFRVSAHSLMLAILIQIGSPFAFLYMYLSSIVDVSTLHKQIVRFQPDKAQGKSDAVENESSKGEKVLDPTSPSEDRFSVNFILTQLWLWLFLFSVPSMAFLIKDLRVSLPFPVDPMLYHCAWGAVIFILQSVTNRHDGIVVSRMKLITWFCIPMTVLFVAVSVASLYRAPVFILAFLTMHTVLQFI